MKASGALPHALSLLAQAHGWSALVILTPSALGEGIDGLSQCDRDCLTLLAQATVPLSGVSVRKQLEKRGIGIWGIATVKRSLAKLRKMKLICNSKKGARGYSIPDVSPIVRKAAG